MAILVQCRQGGLLLDCGPTTLTALRSSGLTPEAIDVILLSHQHGDHFAGVPFLLLHELYESARKKPLRVFGPPGTAAKLHALMELLFPGARTPEFPLEYVDVTPDSTTDHGFARSKTFEVHHFSNGIALGYHVVVEGKTIVFSGDTGWTEALVEPAQDADLFICECSSFDRPVDRHMSHAELTSHRDRIGAKRTLLVHPGDDVLAHADELDFELAYDGMEVTL